MRPLQSEAVAPVLAGHDALMLAPTAGGKTEAAVFPILSRLLAEDWAPLSVLYLCPLRALLNNLHPRIEHYATLVGRRAGLWHGDVGESAREAIRDDPPDILLTNYRMLDFLLMRPEDAQLWKNNGPTTLQYLVLDELHTYDGAQGSDVACLIRRLKSRLDTPPGILCCVGTSATIASGGSVNPQVALVDFASQIFGESFTTDALIAEDRLSPEESLSMPSAATDDAVTAPAGHDDDGLHRVPFPFADPDDVEILRADAYESERDFIRAVELQWFTQRPFGRTMLSEDLRSHPFLRRLLRGIAGRERRSGPRHWREVAQHIAKEEPEFGELCTEHQWLVISSFLSLVAYSRAESTGDYFLQIQVQLWVRELHGLLRRVGGEGIRFAWQDDLQAEAHEHWLPMVYCRECGFDGFAALKHEGETALRDAPAQIGEVFLERSNKARVIELCSPNTGTGEGARADDATAAQAPQLDDAGQALLLRTYLCPSCLGLNEQSHCTCSPHAPAGLVVRVHPEPSDGGKPQRLDRCAACHADQGIGFLASRAATLSSVAVSETFISRYNDDPKLLAFTDSVQDASHRAGFFASRAFRFSLRTAIQAVLQTQAEPIPLPELTERVIEHWTQNKLTGLAGGEAKAAALLIPPDLNEHPAYQAYFGQPTADPSAKPHQPSAAARAGLRDLLRTRLSWEITREYGLAVPLGRSLDATGCSTLGFDDSKLQAARAVEMSAAAPRPTPTPRTSPPPT